jgi:hypothetical protein
MAYLWTVTIGYIIALGLIRRVFFYFLRSGPLNPEDSKRVDPLKQEE